MKFSAFKELLSLLRPYRGHILLSVFLSFLPAYFSVWSPFITGQLIDEGLVAKDLGMLWILAGLLLYTKICSFLSTAFVSFCLSSFGAHILVDYRDHLLAKILRFPIRFFDRMSSGQLTTRLTSDINSLQELFSTALVSLIGSVLLIIGIMIGMLIINWRLALVSFAVVPLLIWLIAEFHIRIRRRFGFMRTALSTLNSFAGESFAGSRDLHVLGAHEENQSEFSRHSKRLQIRFNEAVKEYATVNPLVPFIMALMDISIILYGGWQVHTGAMTVGGVVAFLAYASNFSHPVRDFSEKYTVLQQAMASVDRLVEISTHDPEIDEGQESLTAIHQIEFRSVEFVYPGSKTPAVKQLNIHIRAGEKIALLGETGSGKTTTCSLLMRFYEPSSGQILLNGRSIADYSLNALRAQIGWVSQDVTLFSESLRENLRFYDSRISDEELWQVLDLVQLSSWVRNLPRQLDEVLPERGSTLSSGQRQLISMARALVKRPSIVIFDEATAYVDSRTEWQVQQALDKLWADTQFQNTTGLFIAHRLSTLRRCNRMLVYRDGEIVESGTFEELMKLNGYAAYLYQEQFRKLA